MNVIKYVLSEIQQAQGEIILMKAMLSEHDETVENAFETGDIIQELIALKSTSEAREKFYLRINYLDGKIDAYIKLLKDLGFDIDTDYDKKQ